MSYGVLIKNQVMATDINSLNRTAECASTIENGMIFELNSVSATAGEGEVWTATVSPATPTGGVWMAGSPEIVITNAQYKGLDPDPRNFSVAAGTSFDAFKPQIGDIITLTADVITGSKASNTYINQTAADFQANWGASQTASVFSAKLLETTYITIGNERVTAYKFVVLNN